MNGPDIPKINEGIARKFQETEADLSLHRTPVEFFEALLFPHPDPTRFFLTFDVFSYHYMRHLNKGGV